MEDNTIMVFLGVMFCTLIYGAYNGLVVQYPNVLLILLGAVIVYLFLLETELKQLKKIAFKMDDEESMFTKSVGELKAEIESLKETAVSSKMHSRR
ncbi:MAG: hypothetical protein JW727_02850 [Candidatus Aenigmarchaeota archaeon]|nr:hypothetical protein [Candidatus Aenigmarchaeota archaeon]